MIPQDLISVTPSVETPEICQKICEVSFNNCIELIMNFFHHFISNFDQPYFFLVQSIGGTELRCCNLDPGILPIFSTQVQKKKITISGKNAKDFSPFSCATFSSAENNTECEYCVSGYKKSVISIPSAHPPFKVCINATQLSSHHLILTL